MAQVLEHLPRKWETQSSNPTTAKKPKVSTGEKPPYAKPNNKPQTQKIFQIFITD
jgi:hypothetical protein